MEYHDVMLQQTLIVVAMDAEYEAILSNAHLVRQISAHNKLNITVDELTINNHHVYLAKSGVGLVNAALTVLTIVDRCPIDTVLLMGVAGSLSKELDIGDLLIPTHILQHDSYFTGGSDEGFMAPGKLYGSLSPKDRETPEIPVNKKLLAVIETTCKKAGIPFYSGLLLSGSEFAGSVERKLDLVKKRSGAMAVEMEAAGVAQVSVKLGLPFAVIKGIADRLTPEGEVIDDYKRFLSTTSSNVSHVINAIFHP